MTQKKHMWKSWSGSYSTEEYYDKLQSSIKKQIQQEAKSRDIDELQFFDYLVKTGLRQVNGLGDW